MREGELDVYIARHIPIQPEILNTREAEVGSAPASHNERLLLSLQLKQSSVKVFNN